MAADIAKVLEYLTAKDMTRLLDDDEKGRQIVPTLGGNQEMNKLIDESDKDKRVLQIGGNYANQSLINESGLYSAIR